MGELKCIGRVASLVCGYGGFDVADKTTLNQLKRGDAIRLSPYGPYDQMCGRRTMRPGSARVERLDHALGVIAADTATITAACGGDWIYLEESSSADITAIEAYLASCVRRRDWHGVADAACDLRVLEAVEAARACERPASEEIA